MPLTKEEKAAIVAEEKAKEAAAAMLAGARANGAVMVTVNREQLIAALSLVPVDESEETDEPASPTE
jgi:hypothetical protein